MNILITGGLGFIGSKVTSSLMARGHIVHVADSMDPKVHKSPPTDVPGKTRLSICHANDPALFREKYNCVIHLAAQVSVAASMENPAPFVVQNTVETLELLLQVDTDHIIVASSMSVYGDPETPYPIPERYGLNPASTYGLTKLDQEKLCLFNPQGIATTALRFFNVYGPGQALHNPYTGVLANFANWILKGEQPVVFEDGQQTRDFVNVHDVSKAVCAAATSDTWTPGVYNVCTGQATTIEEAAIQLAEGMGRGDLAPNITGTTRPGDIRHCIGSPDALATQMDWDPLGFEAGIKQYGRWLVKEHKA